MEKAAGETLTSLAVTTRAFGPPTGRVAVGRATAVGRDRQGRAVELEARDHGRADRRPRRRADARWCLNLVRSLADRGLAVLIISHNMNDVFEVADRIAVLRLGRLVAVRPAAEMDTQIVVDLMTTGDVDPRTVEHRRDRP